ADDHTLFRQGVRKAIECEADIEVVGEAGDGIVALAEAIELIPDLILMDMEMPYSDGLQAISAIKRELPEVKIIMLTVYDQDEHLYEAIRHGADGFLSKNMRAGEILASMRAVMKGQIILSECRNKCLCDKTAENGVAQKEVTAPEGMVG
ncbi:MAG: response regulator transcription factor, partial [Anaerolineae bacterium]|nr:response regulator transcription factor [Anaerolineae bacterium]